mmetsp:Transcript_23124/g.36329  ORF Transcript_23124/g.36329 Transcript_23124/m.36329 type:complete len:146 (+) Transcript_23124:10-447(+)
MFGVLATCNDNDPKVLKFSARLLKLQPTRILPCKLKFVFHTSKSRAILVGLTDLPIALNISVLCTSSVRVAESGSSADSDKLLALFLLAFDCNGVRRPMLVDSETARSEDSDSLSTDLQSLQVLRGERGERGVRVRRVLVGERGD